MTNPEEIQTSQFEFILASAESLDVEAKKVSISGSSGTSTLGYDFLILATGSRAKDDAPFKGVGSTEDTKAARHDFHARVKKAKTIVVAGGGVTGCEAAGELAYEYGREKEIIFVRSHTLPIFLYIATRYDPSFLQREKKTTYCP